MVPLHSLSVRSLNDDVLKAHRDPKSLPLRFPSWNLISEEDIHGSELGKTNHFLILRKSQLIKLMKYETENMSLERLHLTVAFSNVVLLKAHQNL